MKMWELTWAPHVNWSFWSLEFFFSAPTNLCRTVGSPLVLERRNCEFSHWHQQIRVILMVQLHFSRIHERVNFRKKKDFSPIRNDEMRWPTQFAK